VLNASTTFVLYSGIKNSKHWIVVFIAFCDETLHSSNIFPSMFCFFRKCVQVMLSAQVWD
jgi:hypothetical protein